MNHLALSFTPYDHPEIKRQRIVIPEQKTQVQKFDDGRDLTCV